VLRTRLSGTTILCLVALVLLGVLLLERRPAPGGRFLADPVMTPGSVNPDVTPATLNTTVCVSGWTATIRPPSSYTSALKIEQLRAYGFPGGPADYQEDHLISLGLGGNPTDARNLWPEPLPRALEVDETERDLHHKLCAGELSLEEVQRRIVAIKQTAG
jgi:hypothetical protein